MRRRRARAPPCAPAAPAVSRGAAPAARASHPRLLRRRQQSVELRRARELGRGAKAAQVRIVPLHQLARRRQGRVFGGGYDGGGQYGGRGWHAGPGGRAVGTEALLSSAIGGRKYGVGRRRAGGAGERTCQQLRGQAAACRRLARAARCDVFQLLQRAGRLRPRGARVGARGDVNGR